jgi:large subunit ribosomal protein L31
VKQNIHPTYYSDAKITCACGNTFNVGSTKQQIHVEICSNCHPFFTGESKFIDTLGKVERFQKRLSQVADKRKTAKKDDIIKEAEERPANLYEMANKIKQEFKNQKQES